MAAPEPFSAASIDDLHRAVEDSHKSLGKIGEGDWTPQDTAHKNLLTMIEKLLASVAAE